MADISTEVREAAAEKGEALPDGSYPIRNKADLKRAIQAYGRAKDKEKTKKFIIKRAKEPEAVDMLPKEWLEDEGLKHHGIKGMKWGVRRPLGPTGRVEVTTITTPGKKVKAEGGSGQPAHEDAVRVATSKQKAKMSTTDSLSTKELQELVNRMNLEQQYSRLTSDPSKSTAKQGQQKVKDILSMAKTANEVYTFANSPLAKQLAAGLMKAKTKAKTKAV